MNRKLQFLMMLLLMIGGVTSAWAGDITPTEEVNYRPKSDKSGFDSSTPKEASETNNKFEVNHSARFFALQKYTVENLEYVKSLRLTLRAASSMAINELAVWIYNSNTLPTTTTSETATALFDAYKAVTGVDLGATGTNKTTSLLKDAATGNSTDGDVKTAYFDITGDALTALKAAASSGTFTLLITNKTDHVNGNSNQKREYYTSGHATEALRPTLTPEYYAVYNATTSTGYSSLNEAMNAATSSADIYLYDDCVIGARATTQTTGITLNIIPKADVTITASHNRGEMWILGNKSGTTLNIGSDDNKITFQSTGSSRIILNNVCAAEAGTMNLTNIVFDNIQFSGEASNKIGKAIYYKSGASGTLRNVSFKNCTISDAANAEYTPKAFIYSEDTANDRLYLDKSLNFDSDCSTPHIYAKGRMRMTEADRASFTCDEPIQILWGGSTDIGTNVIVRISEVYKDAFQLANGDYMSLAINTNNRTDLYITQSYSLTVSAAGAATLVLPFESTIPTGATCYTLTHTDGSSVVTATEVTGGTLAVNTPVLVNAEAGTYKFVSTATSGSIATGSGTATVGALTGVYSDLTFTTENIASTYANTYILNKINDNVGFYKAADGKKVGANRAYLTANDVPVVNNARSLRIVFGGDITGVNEVSAKKPVIEDGIYYNLSGQRVAHPTHGLYIVNGKKVFIK